MPQIQVINREPDQMAQNIQKAGDSLIENIQKSQALRQTAVYYKIQAKNAENETARIENERRSKLSENMATIFDKIKDPNARGILIADLIKQSDGRLGDADVVGSFAHRLMQAATSQSEEERMSLEAQKAKTAIYNKLAGIPQQTVVTQQEQQYSEPALSTNPSSALEGIFPYTFNTNPALAARIANLSMQTQSQQTPQQMSQQTSQEQTSIPQDEMLLTGMKLDGMDISNLGAEKKRAFEMAAAAERGKASVPNIGAEQVKELREVQYRKSLIDQMKTEADAIKISGFGKGQMAYGTAMLSSGKQNPELFSYVNKMPARAAAIYRDLTGDTRLSDQDAAARAMGLIWNPLRDDISLRGKYFKELEDLRAARERLLREGNYVLGEGGVLITPLESLRKEVKKGSMREGSPGANFIETTPTYKDPRDMTKEEIESELYGGY